MSENNSFFEVALDISIWGFFLILAAILVGALYEQKKKKLEQLKLAYIGILEILSKYLESYDRYTQGHSVRVSRYATEIAIAMSLSHQTVENIRVAALLHDIGKVDVSFDLLQKSARLTKEEKELINKHSKKGGELLGLVGSVLEEAIPLVVAHHRYFYEEKKNKGSVPLGSRIIAVADAYDALVTDRPYRAAKPPWQAIAEIEKEVDRKFDPEVVKIFKQLLPRIIEENASTGDMTVLKQQEV